MSDRWLITTKVTGSLEFAREIMVALQLLSDTEIETWYRMFKPEGAPDLKTHG